LRIDKCDWKQPSTLTALHLWCSYRCSTLFAEKPSARLATSFHLGSMRGAQALVARLTSCTRSALSTSPVPLLEDLAASTSGGSGVCDIAGRSGSGWTALSIVRGCALVATPVPQAETLLPGSNAVAAVQGLGDYNRRLRELLAAQAAPATLTQPAGDPSIPPRRKLPSLDQIPMLQIPSKQKAPVPPSHKQPLTWQQILELARKSYGPGPITGDQMLTDTFRQDLADVDTRRS
jgi:hypothetical protein